MDTQVILFGLWVALMFIFLLGDVIRIFAGDYEPGKIMGKKAGQATWLAIAAIMITPILIAVLTLTLDQSAARIVNLAGASIWFLFNAFSIASYPGYYDRFLLAVSLGVNILTIYHAYSWV